MFSICLVLTGVLGSSSTDMADTECWGSGCMLVGRIAGNGGGAPPPRFRIIIVITSTNRFGSMPDSDIGENSIRGRTSPSIATVCSFARIELTIADKRVESAMRLAICFLHASSSATRVASSASRTASSDACSLPDRSS